MLSAYNPFVAGRTYSPYLNPHPNAECLFADYKTVVLRWTNGTVLTGSPEKFFSEGWKEVVIPHWEVGKHYEGAATQRDYECLWTNGTYAILLWIGSDGEPKAQVSKDVHLYIKGK